MSESQTPILTTEPVDQSRLVWEVAALRAEVDTMKKKAESGRDFGKILAIAGGALGILSAIIAFPKGIKETSDAVFTKPHTSYETTELVVRYNPTAKGFQLELPLYVKNSGSGDDAIRTANSTIYYSPSPSPNNIMKSSSESVDDGVGDFAFYNDAPTNLSQAVSIPRPVAISKQSQKIITLSINTDIGAFAKKGWNLLDVHLSSDRGVDSEVQYCFFLDEQQISDIESLEKDGHKRFLASECGDS
jgi:hypothetical protein